MEPIVSLQQTDSASAFLFEPELRSEEEVERTEDIEFSRESTPAPEVICEQAPQPQKLSEPVCEIEELPTSDAGSEPELPPLVEKAVPDSVPEPEPEPLSLLILEYEPELETSDLMIQQERPTELHESLQKPQHEQELQPEPLEEPDSEKQAEQKPLEEEEQPEPGPEPQCSPEQPKETETAPQQTPPPEPVS